MRSIALLASAFALLMFSPGNASSEPISPEGASRACRGATRDANGDCIKCGKTNCRWVSCKKFKDCVIVIVHPVTGQPNQTQTNSPFSPGILGSGYELPTNAPSATGTPIAPIPPRAPAPVRIN